VQSFLEIIFLNVKEQLRRVNCVRKANASAEPLTSTWALFFWIRTWYELFRQTAIENLKKYTSPGMVLIKFGQKFPSRKRNILMTVFCIPRELWINLCITSTNCILYTVVFHFIYFPFIHLQVKTYGYRNDPI
jgi:hypothetical protein